MINDDDDDDVALFTKPYSYSQYALCCETQWADKESKLINQINFYTISSDVCI